MINFLKRYKFVILAFIGMIIFTIVNFELGIKTTKMIGNSLIEMLIVIPPIFIMLGLLDVWVPKETMVKYMGEGSGMIGIALAMFIGSAAAGPLYGAFPVAGVFMKKGVKFSNVLIFIGAWSTTKLPLLMFETSSMGLKFMLTRLLVNIPGIIIMAYLIYWYIGKQGAHEIYEKYIQAEQKV